MGGSGQAMNGGGGGRGCVVKSRPGRGGRARLSCHPCLPGPLSAVVGSRAVLVQIDFGSGPCFLRALGSPIILTGCRPGNQALHQVRGAPRQRLLTAIQLLVRPPLVHNSSSPAICPAAADRCFPPPVCWVHYYCCSVSVSPLARAS